MLHGYTLHTIYGWSIHLIGALWDSVTNLLLHLARGTPKNKENQRKEEMQDPSHPRKQEDTTDTSHTQLMQSPICQFSVKDETQNMKKVNIRNESHNMYLQL